jgi:hypothetical protein
MPTKRPNLRIPFSPVLGRAASAPSLPLAAVARLHLWHDDGGCGLRDKGVHAALGAPLVLAIGEEGEEGADGAEKENDHRGHGAPEANAVGDRATSVENLVARGEEDGEVKSEGDESEEL